MIVECLASSKNWLKSDFYNALIVEYLASPVQEVELNPDDNEWLNQDFHDALLVNLEAIVASPEAEEEVELSTWLDDFLASPTPEDEEDAATPTVDEVELSTWLEDFLASPTQEAKKDTSVA